MPITQPLNREGGFYPETPTEITRQELEEKQQQEDLLQNVSPENAGFVSGAYQDANALLDQSWRGRARNLLIQAGAPMNDALVRDMLDSVEAQSESFDAKPGLFDALMSTTVDGLIRAGKITETQYSQALQASGFGFERPEFVEIDPTLLGSGDSAFLHNITEASKDFVIHPETGWKQYKNGTLVDPNQPLGSFSAVQFDPSSRVPGSQR